MSRQSISFSSPNNTWLKSQVENKEYSSKSEVINDLVRKARIKQEKLEFIRNKLTQAEDSGLVSQNGNEILSEIKKDLKIGSKV